MPTALSFSTLHRLKGPETVCPLLPVTNRTVGAGFQQASRRTDNLGWNINALQPQTQVIRETSINHPTSMFQNSLTWPLYGPTSPNGLLKRTPYIHVPTFGSLLYYKLSTNLQRSRHLLVRSQRLAHVRQHKASLQ